MTTLPLLLFLLLSSSRMQWYRQSPSRLGTDGLWVLRLHGQVCERPRGIPNVRSRWYPVWFPKERHLLSPFRFQTLFPILTPVFPLFYFCYRNEDEKIPWTQLHTASLFPNNSVPIYMIAWYNFCASITTSSLRLTLCPSFPFSLFF